MLSQIIRGLVRSFAQTDDHSTDPALKTRYYKISRDKAMEEIRVVISRLPGYQFCFEIKNAGELVFAKKTWSGRLQDITVTVTKTGALQTAVDIYSASRGSMGDLGSNYRIIRNMFNKLDQHLPK